MRTYHPKNDAEQPFTSPYIHLIFNRHHHHHHFILVMTSSPTPRLRLLAGPSPSHLTDISALVNTSQAHTIQSERFVGKVVVHVKGFPGADESEYFERDDRKGVTWSIQVQGQYPAVPSLCLYSECGVKRQVLAPTFGRRYTLWKHV